MIGRRLIVLGLLLACARPGGAQSVSQRGFLDTRVTLYPQKAPRDATRVVSETLFRYEPSVRFSERFRVNAAFDARAETHDQVALAWRIDWQDRGTRRPALSVRRLEAALSTHLVTLQVGKQFVRWGKADILNPTDRFAPRDFMTVVDNDFLAVTGARAIVHHGDHSLDVLWVPRFTPSRIPLFDQRWTRLPETLALLPVRDGGTELPGGSETGARWNYVGSLLELSVSGFDGYHHVPVVQAAFSPFPPAVVLRRTYPRIRTIGADAAMPLRPFTVKGEIAYTTARGDQADDYVLYVIQLERQTGEWSLVGGYAGEVVTDTGVDPTFSLERGFARSLVGRAAYTFDANRSVAFEGVVRQNGRGAWLKAEYSRASGQHLRTTASVTWIRGRDDDFLGQYRLNSHATITARYSF